MRNFIPILKKFILLNLIIIIVSGYFLLYTTPGLHTIYKTTNYLIPGNLKITGLKGNVLNGISLESLIYASEDIKLDITNFSSELNIDIFKNNLTVKSINVDSIAILLEDSPTTSEENVPVNYPVWLNLDIEQFKIEYLLIRKPHISPILIQKINISANMKKNNLIIKEIKANSNNYKFNLKGELILGEDFHLSLDFDAINDVIHQEYNTKITGTENHIKGTISANNITSIDLNFDVNIQDNLLTIKSNWSDGNILYNNQNYGLHKGNFDLSTKILLSNNQSCSSFYCMFNSITKDINEEHEIAFDKIISSISSNSYIVTSNNKIIFGKNSFSTDGELAVKNSKVSMNMKTKYIINRKNNSIDFKEFKMTDENNTINISGELSKQSDLKYDINIQDLSKYSSLLGGKISSSGEIHGDFLSPRAKIFAELNKLVLPNFRNDYCKLDINFNFDNLKSSGIIYVKNLKYDDILVDLIDVSLKNKNNKQYMAALININKYKVNTDIVYITEKDRSSFTLDKLNLIDPTNKTWDIQKPTKLTIKEQRMYMDNQLCIVSNNDKLCLNFSYLNKKNFSIKANIKTDNNLLNYYIKPFQIITPISFDMNYIAQDNHIIKADLNLSSNNTVILSGIGEKFTIKEINFLTKLIDNSVILQAKIINDDSNGTTFNLNYANTSLLAQSLVKAKISGQLKSKYSDHRILDSLSTSIDDIIGILDTNILVSGTIQKPIFNGFSKIENGSILVVPSMLAINDINSRFEIKDNSFSLSTKAKAGKGDIKMEGSGQVQNYNLSELDFKINANTFRISDTSKITLDINSNLTISKNNFFSLNGNIDVINGKVIIDSFPEVESLSNDIVINAQDDNGNKSPLYYDLTLNIFDKINLLAYGISGNLKGKLRLVNNDIFSDAVFGRINIIKGKYRFFSNSLVIKKGELSYTGSNIDDPRIDLRATLDIFSDYNIVDEEIPKLVGVKASGKIDDPEIVLFAKPPAFSQVDILSYLALGKSTKQISDNAQSSITSVIVLLQGSNNDLGAINKLQKATGFDIDISTEYSSVPETQEDLKDKSQVSERTNYFIGKQITPKLNVSAGYSKGTDDVQRVIRATYSITKRWKISLEKKEEIDSAVRLLYNIEFW